MYDALWRHQAEKKKFSKECKKLLMIHMGTVCYLSLTLSKKKNSSCFKLGLCHHLEVVDQSVPKWAEPGEQMALHIILIPGWSAEVRPWGGNLLGEFERKLDHGPRVWSTHTHSSSSINLKVLLHLLMSAFMETIRVGLEVLCNQGTFCFNAFILTTSTTKNFLRLITGWLSTRM